MVSQMGKMACLLIGQGFFALTDPFDVIHAEEFALEASTLVVGIGIGHSPAASCHSLQQPDEWAFWIRVDAQVVVIQEEQIVAQFMG